MLDLSGKVAFVTGAGSGIGRGISLALAGAGADVACIDIRAAAAEETATNIIGLGRKAIAREADVRSRTALGEAVDATVAELGGLDICVANAGIGRGGSVLTMTEEDWDIQSDINLKGVFLTVQAAARAMVRQNRGGRVITIASLAAERASGPLFAYCATKAGVRMMSRCWAQDLAPFGITVNSIGPGIIDTPLAQGLIGEGDQRVMTERNVPIGRLGYPQDIGNLACWLASDEAEYVTGTYNLIDGGLADRGNFGAESPQAQMIAMVREGREKLGGERLLAMIDQLSGQARAEGDRLRRERGLV
jgi:NAD(P)-dependent dehydrogenase (short-subunit alcohol dehydrogenase family)